MSKNILKKLNIKKSNHKIKNQKRRNKKNDFDDKDRIIDDNSQFQTIESYNTLRTNIMFSLPKSETGKKIIITSASPAEGKTTTCINLAITFAKMGLKVLVIDCDLRKPKVHRYLKLDRDKGVSNVLCGFEEFDKTINRNVRKNLDVITSGEVPSNPAEIISSEEFSKMLSEAERIYDYIFIDSPPVSVVADAVVMSEECSGIIIVVRQDVTNLDLLDETIESLEKSSTKIIGITMIADESSNSGKSYGRYKYKYRYEYRE